MVDLIGLSGKTPLIRCAQQAAAKDGKDAEDDIEMGEGDDDEPSEGEEEEVEVTQAEAPYMERLAGGHRVKVLPDIAKFLSP